MNEKNFKPWLSIKVEFKDGSNLYIRYEEYEHALKILEAVEQLEEAKNVAKRLLKLSEE